MRFEQRIETSLFECEIKATLMDDVKLIQQIQLNDILIRLMKSLLSCKVYDVRHGEKNNLLLQVTWKKSNGEVLDPEGLPDNFKLSEDRLTLTINVSKIIAILWISLNNDP
jgi:hypothetical protein